MYRRKGTVLERKGVPAMSEEGDGHFYTTTTIVLGLFLSVRSCNGKCLLRLTVGEITYYCHSFSTLDRLNHSLAPSY